jgi:hypothetical protein
MRLPKSLVGSLVHFGYASQGSVRRSGCRKPLRSRRQ